MSEQGVVARDSKNDLVQALNSGQLSDALVKQGQSILARIEKPLRLSVLGLPGSGKSKLINFLAGEQVFPEGLRLPTLSLVYGDTPSASCTLPDGQVKTLDSVDLYAVAKLKPAFVELALPLPALRKLSMLEVVAGDDAVELNRAVAWAGKRTDIALWCTQVCSNREEQLWAMLPERVQDHSFLVLTKADELGEKGMLAGLDRKANSVGLDYFRKVLPIATSVALSARMPDGSVDKPTLKSSGGMALISAILREVDTGQRAASDAAEIFLRQVGFDPTSVPATPEKPKVEAAKPKLVEAAPVEETPEVAAQPEPEPEVIPVAEPVAEVDPDAPMTQDARSLCKQAIDQLAAEGEALAHQLEAGELEARAIIDVSVDTVTWLADYLSGNDAAEEPAMARTCATANDAADLVQLIQLEKGENVALDALSLMIQLKHEIQAELAA